MGEVDHGQKIVDDLRVEIKDVCYVYPSEPMDRTSMFMSNIDQVLNFDVQTVHFFAASRDFPPRLVTQTLKEALGKVLVPYSFLAGRLNTDGKTGRLEFDCNGKGVGFVAAESARSVDEIGDLSYPNRAFGQLVAQTVHNLLDRTAAPCRPPSDDDEYDHPLAIFQVTSFRCGGFAIGLSINHTTFDGISTRLFLDNLAAVAGGKPLLVPPCNDRRLLAARSPPRVTYPHPERRQLNASAAQVFETTEEDLDFKIFRLTSSHVSLLKQKARNPHATSPSPVSGFYAVAALIWRCKALSYSPLGGGGDQDRVSTILYAVNIRHKLLTPPLAASYTGNAALTAYARAKCSEILEAPLWRMAEMAAEGGKMITEEYVRSVIDWGEVYGRGFPHGEVLVSSWWRLGFAEVDYPWGKPIYSCPVVHHRKDVVLVFPDSVDEDGVNVIVALPPHQMRKFAGGGEEDRVSTILYAVNIRHKLLTPPLVASYTGNAVLTAYASAKCSKIPEAPLWRMAEMAAEGGKRITEEYARSVIDWGEVYGRGFPQGEVLVSSWCRLGFAEVDYPWGKPIYCCRPVVHHRKDIVLLFPDIVEEDGVNVIVALPPAQVRKFGSLFDAVLSFLVNL